MAAPPEQPSPSTRMGGWRAVLLAVGLGIAVGLVVALFIAGRKPAAVRHLKRAIKLSMSGDYDAALAECDKAIEASPEGPLRGACYAVRADVHVHHGDLDAAIRDYSAAIDQDPQNPAHYVSRCTLRCRNGQAQAAIADATKAIELNTDPRSAPRFLLCRADACSKAGDLDGVIRDCSKLIELQPRVSEHYNSRGWARVRKGDFEAAIPDIELAIALAPRAHYYDSRAWAFLHLGRLDEAEADAHKAASLHRKYAWHHALLFRIETARGHREKAVAQARVFIDSDQKGEQADAARLLLRYYLGEEPLDTLRKHDEWENYDVGVRGYQPAQPGP